MADGPALAAASGADGVGAPASGRAARWVAVTVGLVLVAFLVVLGLQTFGEESARTNPVIGRVTPPVQGGTLDGEGFDIDLHRGRWVVVNFFAEWCTPCRVEHPELVAFSERHAESDDVVVVSVAFNDEPENVADFFADNGGDWAVIASDTGRIALDFGVTGVPESYLVDPNGVVFAGFEGVTADALDDAIAARVEQYEQAPEDGT
jgi:cytochrome c biogenesis protein CcmG, thiol:disulfide interchange protein DsbE